MVAGAGQVARAAPVRLPIGGMDAHFCADYGQGQHGSWAGVLACNGPNIGPISFRGTGGSTVESDILGFQCVELVDRYLFALKGWSTQMWDGADLARIYGAAHHIVPIRSGNHVGRRPQPGDVIAFSVFANFTDHNHNFPGHVAIVIGTGPHTLTLLNENWNEGAAITSLGISGTTVQPILTDSKHHGLVNTRYIEWLPVRVAPPRGGYGPFYVTGNSQQGLAIHRSTSVSSPVMSHLAKGAATFVACQVIGTRYATGAAPSTDAIWDKLRSGGFVQNFWVSAPSATALSPGVARC
jgi:hypothetical protein